MKKLDKLLTRHLKIKNKGERGNPRDNSRNQCRKIERLVCLNGNIDDKMLDEIANIDSTLNKN